MRALLFRMAILPITAAVGIACGGDNGPGPGAPVLTTVEVSPAAAALFTVAPENAVDLTVVAKDQDGQTMTGLGSPTFSSGNTAVAEVSENGTITATGAGTTQVTVSLTAGGVTETATTTVAVQVAPTSASVQAPQLVFQPQLVDLSAGGAVTWVVGGIHHTVDFTTTNAPADIPELENASAARTFPSQGTFSYRCSIHPAMTGTIRVH
ncbi:MAG TPA: hypothetical protein VJ808_02985 [Gemmatimonadales bacterium]|nr:hypothetical protein [Gemmatimonadales bacterium]